VSGSWSGGSDDDGCINTALIELIVFGMIVLGTIIGLSLYGVDVP